MTALHQSPFRLGYQSCQEFPATVEDGYTLTVVALEAQLAHQKKGWWERFGLFGQFLADLLELGRTEENQVRLFSQRRSCHLFLLQCSLPFRRSCVFGTNFKRQRMRGFLGIIRWGAILLAGRGII